MSEVTGDDEVGCCLIEKDLSLSSLGFDDFPFCNLSIGAMGLDFAGINGLPKFKFIVFRFLELLNIRGFLRHRLLLPGFIHGFFLCGLLLLPSLPFLIELLNLISFRRITLGMK
jgi:hypothetical protein